MPTREKIAKYSPALIATSWLLLTWEWSREGYFTLPLAIIAGATFQAILTLFLGLASILAATWLKIRAPELHSHAPGNPHVLGSLLVISALWMYQAHKDREAQDFMVDCLETRAARLRVELEDGRTLKELESDVQLGDRLSLDPGGIRWAIQACKDVHTETSDDE